MNKDSKSLVHGHPSLSSCLRDTLAQLCEAWLLKDAWAECKESDSDVQCKWVEAKQCLSVLRQSTWTNGDIDAMCNARVEWGWTVLALKLRNTVFTREVLVQNWQHGAIFFNVIANCRDSLVAYCMKAMNQALRVATYLHTINPIKHSHVCTQCDQGEVFSIFSVSVLNFIKLG